MNFYIKSMPVITEYQQIDFHNLNKAIMQIDAPIGSQQFN